MSETKFQTKFKDLVVPEASKIGLEVYDITHVPGKEVLSLYVWRPEERTAELEDCVALNKALSPIIEENEWISKAFTLEISSPGVERKLKGPKHFIQAKGEWAVIHMSAPLSKYSTAAESGKKDKAFKGVVEIKEASQEGFTAFIPELQENADFPYEQLRKAHIYYNFDKGTPHP